MYIKIMLHFKILVPWGQIHVVATEINEFLRVTVVYLIKYRYVDVKTFPVNYDTQQNTYNEDNIPRYI
jgi:hypothetical protein